MNRGGAAFGKRIARALIAFLVVSIALGRALDAAAHAAGEEVEAGNPSPLLKFVAAFDVIDDAFDHQTCDHPKGDHQNGEAPNEKGQIVVQLALPEPDLISVATIVATPVEHVQRVTDVLTSRSPPPPERPPRA